MYLLSEVTIAQKIVNICDIQQIMIICVHIYMKKWTVADLSDIVTISSITLSEQNTCCSYEKESFSFSIMEHYFKIYELLSAITLDMLFCTGNGTEGEHIPPAPKISRRICTKNLHLTTRQILPNKLQ